MVANRTNLGVRAGQRFKLSWRGCCCASMEVPYIQVALQGPEWSLCMRLGGSTTQLQQVTEWICFAGLSAITLHMQVSWMQGIFSACHDLPSKALREIWASPNVHCTAVISTLFLCVKRSHLFPAWYRSNSQALLVESNSIS